MGEDTWKHPSAFISRELDLSLPSLMHLSDILSLPVFQTCTEAHMGERVVKILLHLILHVVQASMALTWEVYVCQDNILRAITFYY